MEGSTVIGKDGKPTNVPEWKPYHSKNVLHGDNVQALSSYGNDMWIATDRALNHYEWAQIEATFFYEQLLPSFGLSELWHMFGAIAVPTEDWGTWGISANFVNMGTNQWTDELGQVLGEARSWEGVFGLSYGIPFSQTLSMGMNIKFVVSALAPGYEGAGTGLLCRRPRHTQAGPLLA